MAIMPLSPLTWTGVLLSLVLPVPCVPPAPQAQTVPSVLRALLWLFPAATAVTPLKRAICVGVVVQETPLLQVVVLRTPSWPELFAPQAQTVPSLLRARSC